MAAPNADNKKSWWELRRDSSEQAPPAATDEAIIQVYAARAARWRGKVGVHTWISTKRRSEKNYTRMEVVGWGVSRGRNAVRIREGSPDNYWFGNRPVLLRDIRGTEKVEALIDRVHDAANSYPYNDVYTIWPGPNSNTFTAYVARAVPEMRLDLPSNAVGKDYVPWNKLISKASIDFELSLPHEGFHRQIGVFAGKPINPEGKIITQEEFDNNKFDWLPTVADGDFIQSLMVPVTEAGQYASWIAPPRVGIDNQPGEFEYVKLHMA